jgi:hypothetical protein
VLVLKHDGLDMVEVLANGRPIVRDGRLAVREQFLADSDRVWSSGGDDDKAASRRHCRTGGRSRGCAANL